LARKIATTIAYLALAYLLMFSYQIFTQTALSSVTASISSFSPFLASILINRTNTAIFIFSFAWTFVLSTIIYRLTFGGINRLFIRFLISLGLTVASTAIINQFNLYGIDVTNPNLITPSLCAQLFSNPAFAFIYLALPFIFMIVIDLNLTKKVQEITRSQKQTAA
jgi:hypothetical protein